MLAESAERLPQLYRLAHALLFCKSRQDTLQTAVASLAKSLHARNAVLWTFSAEKGMLVPDTTVLEDKRLKIRNVSRSADLLGEAYRTHKSLVLAADGVPPLKHLQFPEGEAPQNLLLFAFREHKEWEGVLEFINRSEGQPGFTQEDLAFVREAMELVTAAVHSWKSREEQTGHQLHAITRLTLLYDISQIFHSTLELGELLPIITEKIRDILGAETCTIWVPDETGERFRCSYSTGGYAEIFTPYTAGLDDDPAGEAYRTGEGILLEDASEEEQLQKRFQNLEETPIITYLNAPLLYKEKVIGVLEIMNRVEGEAFFSEEDHFLLNDLAQQAAVSIYNANLLATERKAKELDSLLKVSREITSTLDLNHVLLTVVNQAANLVPFDRVSIGLQDRGTLRVSAVSGQMEVDRKNPEIRELEQILEWTAGLKAGLYVSELDGRIATDREEVREKFKVYFEKTGHKSFVAIPLKDEEGQLGILSFESAQPYFLDERHLEVVSILANQVTVAIRNAQLYRQVPLIDLMKPLMKKKAQIMMMPQSRRIAWTAGAAAVVVLLAVIPWNMKVMGDVTVLPWLRTPVVSEVEGILRDVYSREGDRVSRGKVVARLMDQDYRLALERSRTQKDLLIKEITRSESTGDSVTARLKRIEMDQVDREIQYSAAQLARTNLTSPVDGVVTTPRIEEKKGQLIHKGEEFCQVADMKGVRAEMAMDEADISYLRTGQRVILKMNSYPTLKFYGTVKLLGAELTNMESHPVFVLQAQIDDPGQILKPGMVGQSKVEVGYHSIGYVLLRTPVGFLWKKFWTWLP